MVVTISDPAVSDEEALVRRSQAGDTAAFAELVRRHTERLMAMLSRMIGDRTLAQDVLQEVFLRAWRGLPRFDGRSKFSTWIHRIAINEANRALERKGRMTANEQGGDDQLLAVADTGSSPGESAEQRELLDALDRALRRLDPELRLPILLRDVEGLSTREAAAALEVSEAAFKSRLHRGRMALREIVDPFLADGDAVESIPPGEGSKH
jgi:RNA polymerase sigma-70 factor (ECF subfamily)